MAPFSGLTAHGSGESGESGISGTVPFSGLAVPCFVTAFFGVFLVGGFCFVPVSSGKINLRVFPAAPVQDKFMPDYQYRLRLTFLAEQIQSLFRTYRRGFQYGTFYKFPRFQRVGYGSNGFFGNPALADVDNRILSGGQRFQSGALFAAQIFLSRRFFRFFRLFRLFCRCR